MNRPVAAVAAIAAVGLGLLAFALPAAADVPIGNPLGVVGNLVSGSGQSAPAAASVVTTSASSTTVMTTSTVTATASAKPRRDDAAEHQGGDAAVSAQVCAALTVDGLHVLGSDPDVSALLHATLNVGRESDAAKVARARRLLGCDDRTGGPRSGATAVQVCAALTVDNLGGVLDRLDADADLAAVVDSARARLGDTVMHARRALCSGSSGVPTATMTAAPAAPATVIPVGGPVAVPAPVGAPETGA